MCLTASQSRVLSGGWTRLHRLQAEATIARERLRESKADLERVEELHRQRLNTLAASAVNQDSKLQYGKQQESADQLVGTLPAKVVKAAQTD